jgi:4-diphosphocytidyl-2-C-methyl-D-erythritol kinase
MGTNEAKIEVDAPAKVNLFLAITGRRADGFHDLVSVVATVGLRDTLRIETLRPGAGGQGAGKFELACDDPAVPADESNLVLKAARAFAASTGWMGSAKFSLTKRVPMGAGLGGGSSDAVAALRGLNTLANGPLSEERLAEIAATLGSDCPLFLQGAPVVMRGRGEQVERLPQGAVARLRGRRILIFKPAFGISTPWAYGQMVARSKALGKQPSTSAEKPPVYLPSAEAEARLGAWSQGTGPAEGLLYNNMEAVAFTKFVALPTLLELLRVRFGLAARMSGSGSACFALLGEGAPVAEITATIREAWGPSVFVTETRIA